MMLNIQGYRLLKCMTVTLTIYINFIFPFQMRFNIKYGFNWQSVSENKMFKYHNDIHEAGFGTEEPLESFVT